MTVDTLEQLSAAFGKWRLGKRHIRERIPEDLLRRARRAVKAHGVSDVARAAKVNRLLLGAQGTGREQGSGAASVPPYSRVELVGPSTASRPFAELETPSGIKVRLFTQTPETMSLLSSVCAGGHR